MARCVSCGKMEGLTYLWESKTFHPEWFGQQVCCSCFDERSSQNSTAQLKADVNEFGKMAVPEVCEVKNDKNVNLLQGPALTNLDEGVFGYLRMIDSLFFFTHKQVIIVPFSGPNSHLELALGGTMMGNPIGGMFASVIAGGISALKNDQKEKNWQV